MAKCAFIAEMYLMHVSLLCLDIHFKKVINYSKMPTMPTVVCFIIPWYFPGIVECKASKHNGPVYKK